jgi:DNA-binding response OmpR family regulator
MQKLLVVDDDEATRRLLKVRLSHAYDVFETGELARALELALAHKPNAILMDLMMPGFSGFELCQSFRNPSYTSRIPIFVVSGESDTRCREHCERLGALDYFQKPIDFKRLQKSPVRGITKMFRRAASVGKSNDESCHSSSWDRRSRGAFR